MAGVSCEIGEAKMKEDQPKNRFIHIRTAAKMRPICISVMTMLPIMAAIESSRRRPRLMMDTSISDTDTPWMFGGYNARAHLKDGHY